MMRLIPALILSIATFSLAQDAMKLPDGHPPMTGGTQMALPAGHPPVSSTRPTSMPAKATGKLTIKVVAKTKDAPIPMNAPVAVHFYTDNKETGHVDTHLDARGMAIVEGFELTPAITQALAVVDYSDVTYQSPSTPMNSAMTEGSVEVSVYQTTTDVPDWRVSMRHVMLEQQEQGLHVVEMLAINNPTDKTWVAKHGEGGRHATVIIRLPDDAQNVELGDGFSSPKSGVVDNHTLNYMEPVVPGSTQLQFGYTLPVKEGKVRLPIVAPAVTRQVMVFVPSDGTQVQASGLSGGEVKGTGKSAVRTYQTKAMDAGSSASLTIMGLKQTAVAKGTLSTGQIVLASAVGLVLIIGTAIMLMKPAKAKQKQG